MTPPAFFEPHPNNWLPNQKEHQSHFAGGPFNTPPWETQGKPAHFEGGEPIPKCCSASGRAQSKVQSLSGKRDAPCTLVVLFLFLPFCGFPSSSRDPLSLFACLRLFFSFSVCPVVSLIVFVYFFVFLRFPRIMLFYCFSYCFACLCSVVSCLSSLYTWVCFVVTVYAYSFSFLISFFSSRTYFCCASFLFIK